MLIGFTSGYSQELVKCIVIETNSGGIIECNLTKHPKLTQNNDVVTLTTDEAVTEFSTTDFKKVYFGEDKTLYKLSYFVDGESYKIKKYEVGESITPEAEPIKEGYTFSGWSKIPKTMPAKDVTVTGTFSVNKYKLVYKVDGKKYKSYNVEYGATITPEAAPTKKGYTFSGWSDIPETMPAKNVTVTGTFSVNKYKLVYKVDGKEYKSYDVEYGATITPEAAPTKEGYTFSGWSNIPKTMPAKNVTVTGAFSVNKYKLVYKVDGKKYKSYNVEYGATITPEAAPTKEGYTFSGWSDIPETMPAKDVTVTGTFSVNKYKLVYKVDGKEYKSYDVEYGATIIPEAAPTKKGYTFSGWSDIPKTMPAKDVTVTGTFSVNKYKLVYKVDGEEYKSYEVEYGATITPEAAPTKEGYTFSGWSDIPATMPAKDVTVTGTFSINKYTVTYIIDNEVFQEDKLEYGAKIVPPEAPKRDGYDFSWGEYPETMPAKDIVITGTYVTGINGVMNCSGLLYNNGCYTLNGLDANESVIVYAASGEIILRYTASDKGELTIRSSQLSTGVNIIKTKIHSFKVIRK